MERQTQIVAMGALVIAVGAGLWFGRGDTASPPPTVDLEPVAAADDESIVVHVSGWVRRPGLVTLEQGARVADAVAAAGGAVEGASLGSLNLATPLVDGQQVMVPGPGGAGAVEADDGKIRINHASATELEQLPGVGPVLAQRIVDYRESNGPFDEVEDLLDVAGIGETKLASLREHIALP